MNITVAKFLEITGLETNERGALIVFLNDLEFPIAISFDLCEFKEDVDKQIGRVVETRQKLLNKYGKDNGDGTFTVPKEKVAEYHKEYDEFASKEITLPEVHLQKEMIIGGQIKVRHIQLLKEIGLIISNSKANDDNKN
ncbi:MAG: hypothetical protein PHX51_07185 [Clostridia bacterium]|nr:hypothetical protein [Clostridia bacterium]